MKGKGSEWRHHCLFFWRGQALAGEAKIKQMMVQHDKHRNRVLWELLWCSKPRIGILTVKLFVDLVGFKAALALRWLVRHTSAYACVGHGAVTLSVRPPAASSVVLFPDLLSGCHEWSSFVPPCSSAMIFLFGRPRTKFSETMSQINSPSS